MVRNNTYLIILDQQYFDVKIFINCGLEIWFECRPGSRRIGIPKMESLMIIWQLGV